MTLEVLVSKAANLTNLEKIGKSDPYVTLLFQGVKKKTNYISGDLNPEWNEKFTWEIGKKPPSPDDSLSIWIKDYELMGRNRLMGETTLLLRNALESSEPLEYELTLYDHNHRPTAGTLFLSVTYHKPEIVSETTDPVSQNNAKPINQFTTQEAQPQNVNILRQDAFTAALSGNRAKYQIRVRVLEARYLMGSNINPVCQVILSQLAKQTRAVKATSSPWWNEVFFFTIECAAIDLYKEILDFRVQNARALRSAMLIGYFKLDLGQIYCQPQHAYINKWLLLKNEDEDSVSEVMGYLKVSISVIGPGDEIPDFATSTDDDKDDVESNLLLPTGTQLKPATFVLDLYQAADLPRMDPGLMEGVKRIFNIEDKKELIDPYFDVSFAGNKVTSRVIYGDDNPHWNEKLFIGFRFPSVCESIRLVLKDWDRVSDDDIISVACIQLPLISAPGHNGFLPCFGPTWVNFYGAPREYKHIRSDYNSLNEGASEGCSFRGRALLSIRTDLGSYPNTKSVSLSSNDTIRVQFYCRRRRFRLHATFLDATMVNVTDTPVEFELSIGNFGNKFEDTFVPSPSATQPTNAVFDGCQYYYLPWKETKPSVVVISQWEDISFRLETLNMLNRIIENLEREIKDFISADSKVEQENNEKATTALIDTFLEETDIILPEPVPGQHQENELDRVLRKKKKEELENLREQAKILRESGADSLEVVNEVEAFVQELKNMAFEPQNSMPDVIVWMLSGKKRIAYQRIPAHQILFSTDECKRGKYCNKTLTLLLKKPKCRQLENSKLPAVIRVKMWLGLEIHEKYWLESQTDAVLTVFAETYENQVSILGNWTNKAPTMGRPSWSDASGIVKLRPNMFVPPSGWRFDGDWFIDPEPSLKYEDDAGRQTFLEDVFENQTRLPGGSWTNATTTWTDIRGDTATPREDIEPPIGWEWEDIWQADVHRAVDEEGWEYTIEATLGGYQPVEKTYHMCRRRRWVRQRNFIKAENITEEMNTEDGLDENGGWEYSTLFNLKFHAKERRMDLVRRRRWHRKLVADNPSAALVFKVSSDPKTKETEGVKISLLSCPRLCLAYKESQQMQLRVYIYQGRDLIAGDKTGFSDPYACVSFMNQSQKTEVIFKTLTPTWDQTLIFDSVTLYGSQEEIAEQPPSAIVEIYDRDAHGDDEFLGRVLLQPIVQNDCTSTNSPHLVWHTLSQEAVDSGEILASCELFFVNDVSPLEPPKRGNIFIVPAWIRPMLQMTAIEILCWGVRNMKTFELSPISCPSVEFECGGKTVRSKSIRDTKINPNFDDPVLYLEMMLPQESDYMPPMNIKVRDHRQFGRKPLVGTHVITSLHSFSCQPVELEINQESIQQYETTDMVIDIPNEAENNLSELADLTIDWWAKYYASVGDFSKAGKYFQLGYDTLQVFPTELEKVEPYCGFSDFLNTFSLKRGISKDLEESNSVGEFKGTFRVYALPSDPNEPRPQRLLKTLPRVTKEEVTVRVYVIKALDLAPKDSNGKADPYVCVKLGKKEVNNRKNYKPNTLSPVFGEVFELSGVLPLDKDLKISVWDYDLLSADDQIGQTVIDLENRYLTKYRATCGLPKSYQVSGLNKWRDTKKPSDILHDTCILHNLPSPHYQSQTVVYIGKMIYTLEEFEKESDGNSHLGCQKQRLALHVLNTMDLVPEHVETRALYNPVSPDLQQGKLQMWVDIFPKSHGQPGPVVDVTPRVPLKYELRIVIWNAYEVPLNETSVIAGDTMSDIYVKCWLADGRSQKTDIHYRSMDGEGNFNWRMVFPFEYLVAENKIVVLKKKHFWSLDETQDCVLPKLSFQIWDNDLFSSDDFLGALEFSLTSLPLPAKSLEKCGLHQLGIEEGIMDDMSKHLLENPQEKCTNLFEKKRIRGFWPCFTHYADQGYSLAGKLEMEIELLSEEEVASKPAARGRDEPNINPKLELPNRPSTSFLWFSSPWRSFKFILWRKYKWYCITLLIIFFALLLVILFIYSFPEAVVRKLVN